MSLTTLSLGRNNDVIYKLFLARESLVSDIPAGDRNIAKLFLQCMQAEIQQPPPSLPPPLTPLLTFPPCTGPATARPRPNQSSQPGI